MLCVGGYGCEERAGRLPGSTKAPAALVGQLSLSITKTRLFKYIENFAYKN